MVNGALPAGHLSLDKARPMFQHACPPPLETSLAVVREWLDKITAASTYPDLDLRNLRAVLTHLLEDR